MMDSSMTSADAAKAGYTKITAEEGKKMLDAGGVTLVDVRTAEEFAAGHIEGAINVANESIGTEMPEALPDKDATILVYCRSGRRSADAAAKLTAIGYTHVYDMGGIIDWPYGTVQ
jgi:phage shock protein E